MTHRFATAFILATAAAWKALLTSCRTITHSAYHPEAHYMRGPGPKWREKHAAGEPRR